MFYQIYKEIFIQQRRYLQIISGLHQGSKKRGPKGEGRAAIYKPVHVSYEQMFRRWMDNVKKFDKDVQKEVDEYRRIRATRPDPVLSLI